MDPGLRIPTYTVYSLVLSGVYFEGNVENMNMLDGKIKDVLEEGKVSS